MIFITKFKYEYVTKIFKPIRGEQSFIFVFLVKFTYFCSPLIGLNFKIENYSYLKFTYLKFL